MSGPSRQQPGGSKFRAWLGESAHIAQIVGTVVFLLLVSGVIVDRTRTPQADPAPPPVPVPPTPTPPTPTPTPEPTPRPTPGPIDPSPKGDDDSAFTPDAFGDEPTYVRPDGPGQDLGPATP